MHRAGDFIWRRGMRYRLAALIFSMMLLGGGAFAQGAKQAATKEGWWIKVDTQKSKPERMVFYVGSHSRSYMFWTVWNPGDAPEFDVLEEFRSSPTVYVRAQTTSGVQCRFCLMYKTKGVKRFAFDLEEDHEQKQTDEDPACK